MCCCVESGGGEVNGDENCLAACRGKGQLQPEGFPRRICSAVFAYGMVLV